MTGREIIKFIKESKSLDRPVVIYSDEIGRYARVSGLSICEAITENTRAKEDVLLIEKGPSSHTLSWEE